MSLFDPASYLDATLTEPSEKRPPLPEGDYTAIINDVKSRTWTGRKDPTKTGIAWDVVLILQVPAEIQAAAGLTADTLTLTDSIMLNLTPQKTIDNSKGANRHLRAYREAVNLNKSGDTFSARALIGQTVLVKIAHDMYEGSPVERVKGVAKI